MANGGPSKQQLNANILRKNNLAKIAKSERRTMQYQFVVLFGQKNNGLGIRKIWP